MITLKIDIFVPHTSESLYKSAQVTSKCDLHQIFSSWLSKVTNSAIKTFNSKKVESGNDLLQNYFVVILSKPIRKVSLKMRFSVLRCDIQLIFFRSSPKQHASLSKLLILNTLNLKMGFCRISAVIMPKPIRKITLKMVFSVPCCDIQQFFFCSSPKQHTPLSKLSI